MNATALKRKPPVLRTEAVGRCPVCMSPGAKELFRSGDRSGWTAGEFVYLRCDDCGTVYQDPRVIAEDRPRAYHEELFYTHSALPELSTTDPPESSLVGRIRNGMREVITATVVGRPQSALRDLLGRGLSLSNSLRRRAFFGISHVELIPHTLHPGRALEVGCGAGQLLRLLHRIGWQATGVEWDPVAAEHARRNTGLTVMVGDLRELELAPASYQLIVLHHVFEHIDDPAETLQRIAELLAQGGRAVLIYPNPNAFGAHYFRASWAHWDPPRHLVFPARKAMSKFGTRAGLRLTSMRTANTSVTPWMNAVSRHIKRGGSTLDEISITFADRVLAKLSRLLNFMGSPTGDEIVVVLTKT